jgi:hypothetical protein
VTNAYYSLTNRRGHYERTFDVPSSAVRGSSGTALITLKLWHGSKSRTAYRTFIVIP